MGNTNYNLLSYDRIPSTQTHALQMIADGIATDKTIVMAAAQSAGRGRGARRWISHHGNLYASFIYVAKERQPTLSYAFAVAAAETLLYFNIPVQIKWPNDLLANGRKISGILLEYCREFLVIGIGINIKTNPSVDLYKTAKTDSWAKGLLPETIMTELIKNFEKWRRTDFSIVRKRWLELSIDFNSPINYKGKPAIYCGLNETGAMVLRRGNKYELVYGDEIFT